MKYYYMKHKDKIIVFNSVKERNLALLQYEGAEEITRANAIKFVHAGVKSAFLYSNNGVKYLCHISNYTESMGKSIGYLFYL